MPEAHVIPLKARDLALEEEARTAARIVGRIREGDSQAETEMVKRYSRGLHYLLARRIGDDERARDLLQETFCIAIEKLRHIDIENPRRLAGYLRGIAVRVALNAGRRRQREPVLIDVDAIAAIPDAEPRPFQHLSTEETQAAVRQLLDGMSMERDRELLIRFYVHDQDKVEVCEALGLTSRQFNQVLFRAKGRLRDRLDKSGQAANILPTER